MAIDTRPAHVFEDVAPVLGPTRPDANVCWCLTYRLPSRENRELVGPARGEAVAKLCGRELAPGILAYEGDTPVGWAGVAPRTELNSFARKNSKLPHLDDEPVWSVWCIRVRPGNRGKGISHALLAGAVEFARSNGAPVVEGYPVDNGAAKVNLTMAYVGTRKLFEETGFTKVADTDSIIDGFARIVMRLDLR